MIPPMTTEEQTRDQPHMTTEELTHDPPHMTTEERTYDSPQDKEKDGKTRRIALFKDVLT